MFHYTPGDAWVDMSSWLVKVPDEPGRSPTMEERPSPEGTRESDLALLHEIMHFRQSVTTNFMFWLSNNVGSSHSIAALMCIMPFFEGGAIKGDSPIPLASIKTMVTKATNILKTEVDGICALDIIEGDAVFTSYRIFHGGTPTHDDVCRQLETVHAGQTRYSAAYKYAADKLGEHAFGAFGPICYLSLQYSHPAKKCTELMELAKDIYWHEPVNRRACRCGRIHSSEIDKRLIYELLARTARSEEDCFPISVVRHGIQEWRDAPDGWIKAPKGVALPDSEGDYKFMTHLVLDPYVEQIQSSHLSEDEILAAVSRPCELSLMGCSPEGNARIWDFLNGFFPPLIFITSQKRLIPGCRLASDDMDYMWRVILETAEIGVIEKVVTEKRTTMECPHRDCPFYSTGLCHKFFLIPRKSFRECAFPDFIRNSRLKGCLPDRLLSGGGRSAKKWHVKGGRGISGDQRSMPGHP
jgi:hypothetical protein